MDRVLQVLLRSFVRHGTLRVTTSRGKVMEFGDGTGVPVALHPEVEVTITMNVARNADEAERQARGEDVTRRREDSEDEAAAAEAAAFFEKPEAASDQGNGEDAKTD